MVNEMQPNCIFCRYYQSKRYNASYYRPVCILGYENAMTCQSFLERPADGDAEIEANAIQSISKQHLLS